MGGGNAFVIGLPAGKELPALPDSGLKSVQDVKGLNVVAVIDMTGMVALCSRSEPDNLFLCSDDSSKESI